MKTRIKLLLIIIPLGIVLLTLIGYTYSYIKNATSQGTPNEINTFSCLDLSLTNANGSTPINLQDAYPISDEEGLKTTPYEFTVTNNCNNVTYVEVNLESLDTANNISADYIKVAVDHSGVMAPIPKILGEQPSKTATIEGAASNNIDTVYLAEGESRTYSLQIWLDEATTKAQAFDKTYEAKVVAVANPTDKYIANVDFKNLDSDTLLYAIQNGDYTFSAPLTRPGRAISLDDEAIISSAPDDYGTSYYFRGSVDNNYVQFAGMCWRIVRITGNGSIKLTLFNRDGTDCAASGGILAYAFVNNSPYSRFNELDNMNIGYMYGNNSSSDYLEKNANINYSSILSKLITWYDEKFITPQKDALLADTIWCNDKKYSGNTYNAATRLNTLSTASPTLICPDDALDGNLSKFTAKDDVFGNAALKSADGQTSYKIGLLTADEVVFAGAAKGINNTTYYLIANTTGYSFWTMTPSASTGIYIVGTNINSYMLTNNGAMRPAISLIPNIKITSGIGTSDNPYVIDEIIS